MLCALGIAAAHIVYCVLPFVCVMGATVLYTYIVYCAHIVYCVLPFVCVMGATVLYVLLANVCAC